MPSDERAPKHSSITDALERLRDRFGPHAFRTIDYWDADLTAVGIVSLREPGRLVYISTAGKSRDRYDAVLELPPEHGSDMPYTPAGERSELDFEGLARIVAEHLRLG